MIYCQKKRGKKEGGVCMWACVCVRSFVCRWVCQWYVCLFECEKGKGIDKAATQSGKTAIVKTNRLCSNQQAFDISSCALCVRFAHSPLFSTLFCMSFFFFLHVTFVQCVRGSVCNCVFVCLLSRDFFILSFFKRRSSASLSLFSMLVSPIKAKLQSSTRFALVAFLASTHEADVKI